MRLTRIAISLLLGALISLAFVAAILALRARLLIDLIIMSGAPLAGILARLIPDAFWHWAANVTGSPAVILLFGIAAWLPFSLLFALLIYWLLQRSSTSSRRASASDGR